MFVPAPTVIVSVLNTGADEKVCIPVNVCAASVRANVADVVGNVMVVLLVLFNWRLVAVPKVMLPPEEVGVVIALYETFHEAAVVPEVKIQVNSADVFEAIKSIGFVPDDSTVIFEVLLFTTQNDCPNTNVEVTGSATNCWFVPVKY